MASYDLKQDFGFKDGSTSVSPSWAICVVRFRDAVSYDVKKQGQNRSLDGVNPIAEREPLIVTSDCLQLNVQTTKAGHVSTMSATLMKGSVDYLAEILPGDWVFCWMANHEEKIIDIIARIKQKLPCNRVDDGLKFMGRVDSVRASRAIERTSGQPFLRYTVAASGFTELDSKIYYDPRISQSLKSGEWFQKAGAAINEIIYWENNHLQTKGTLDPNRVIPMFIKTLLGEGLPKELSDPADTLASAAVADKLQVSANTMYAVPPTVAKLMGRYFGGVPKYADLLDILIGVQHYGTGDNGIASMVPGVETVEGKVKRTGIPLLGEFMVEVPALNNVPVWNILGRYLNPALNEMYTCLRVTGTQTSNGVQYDIAPHVVVRQYPFTTDLHQEGQSALEFLAGSDNGLGAPTRFSELPRWKVSPEMVFDYNIGRTNALRFNYVQVVPVAPVPEPFNRVRNPPVQDDADISRSSLRSYPLTVNCSLKQAKSPDSRWVDHVADYTMGQHLRLNGTLMTVGIQAPVAEGDNLEFDDVIFHIEGVNHTCGIDANGNKTFNTLFALSHGMSAEQMFKEGLAAGLSREEAQYPYMSGKLDPVESVTSEDSLALVNESGSVKTGNIDALLDVAKGILT